MEPFVKARLADGATAAAQQQVAGCTLTTALRQSKSLVISARLTRVT
jgi:hypothetical protein